MTYIIGLTGGIGSGKSEAAECFSALGVPIIDADKIAHELLSPGHPILTQIIERFGTSLLQSNGELNRAALREIIFNHHQHKLWWRSDKALTACHTCPLQALLPRSVFFEYRLFAVHQSNSRQRFLTLVFCKSCC